MTLEDLENAAYDRGVEQGIKQGLEQGAEYSKLEDAIMLIEKYNATPEQAARDTGISLEKLNNALAEKLQAKQN